MKEIKHIEEMLQQEEYICGFCIKEECKVCDIDDFYCNDGYAPCEKYIPCKNEYSDFLEEWLTTIQYEKRNLQSEKDNLIAFLEERIKELEYSIELNEKLKLPGKADIIKKETIEEILEMFKGDNCD